MITKYGVDVVVTIGLISIVVFLLSLSLVHVNALKYGLIVLSIASFAFTVFFFRDPERNIPSGDKFVLSPADGKVVLVKDVYEEEFLKSKAIQVSIFLSPLDVHVNRVPCSGKVSYYRYLKGEYLVAFDEKSSERNERAVIGIENGRGKILIRQIAGFVARRIVCQLKPGDEVRGGERFGMIKFGSRVDVLMPKNSVLQVQLNQKVKAGETILGILR